MENRNPEVSEPKMRIYAEPTPAYDVEVRAFFIPVDVRFKLPVTKCEIFSSQPKKGRTLFVYLRVPHIYPRLVSNGEQRIACANALQSAKLPLK